MNSKPSTSQTADSHENDDLPLSLQTTFLNLIDDPLVAPELTLYSEVSADSACDDNGDIENILHDGALEEVTDSALKDELDDIASVFFEENLPAHPTPRMQQVGGNENDVEPGTSSQKAYILTPRESKASQKFKTSTHSFGLLLNPDRISLENPEQSLENVFDNVLQDVRARVGAENGDRIGVCINHPALNAPIHVPFRRIEEVDGASVIQALDKVSQSNTDFKADGEMDMNILHVANPDKIGYGAGRLSTKKCITIEKMVSRKRSIVQIRNKDNLCFARSIVTGLHFIQKPPADADEDVKTEWVRLTNNFSKKDCTKQEHLARNLHATSGIPLGPCKGRETWELFQEYLQDTAQIKIHVLNSGKCEILYRGNVDRDLPVIHLFHHSKHYDLITSVKGFYGSVEYCELCDKRVYQPVENHPCWNDFKCSKCLHPGYCIRNGGYGHSCTDCNTWFSSTMCYNNHLAPSTHAGLSACQTVHTCVNCLTRYNTATDHDCSAVEEGTRKCKTCKESLNPNHRCFIKPLTTSASDFEKMPYVFYDFESMLLSNGEHVPNLCVIQLGCSDCISNTSDSLCEDCPWRKHNLAPDHGKREIVFSGENTLSATAEWFIHLAANCDFRMKEERQGDSQEGSGESKCKVLAVAHNARGYDLHLLLKAVFPRLLTPPELVMTGQKILQMGIGGVIFKDSLNFITMALEDFPKTFSLTEAAKGYFPHLFSTPANQDHDGKALPAIHFYNPDGMRADKRKKFLAWYKQNKNNAFNYQSELLKYCRSDVDILRQGCGKFRDMFATMNDVDPFIQCITLPSACMTVFRKNFLPEKLIAILPPQGYHPDKNQSAIALQWLAWLQYSNPNMRLQHARTTGGELKLNCGPHTFSVDGYDIDNKIVYSFLGDIWHGCRKHYKETKDVNYSLGTTSRERYEWTMYRLNLIRQHPEVKDVVTMWECDFKEMIKSNSQCRDFIENLKRDADDEGAFTPPLQARLAFYGGRTNAIMLHKKCSEGEKIKYVDVCSLYPYICKYGRFPTGHPTVLFAPALDQLFEIHGLIQCRVLPPGDLFHGMLPYRTNDKLYFPLCRTCADTGYDSGPCRHSDKQRSWTGTYATIELHYAVRNCGYKVLKIYDAWHFENFEQYDSQTSEGGIFTGYIDTFFKMKQESSGYPEGCDTGLERQEYIDSVHAKEGVQLQADEIGKNPGKRAISKSMLNNLWGKFSQKNDHDISQFVSDLPVFYDIIRNENVSVKDISIINDNVLLMSYAYSKESVKPHGCSNVAVASWVTAQARIKLYSAIHPLGDRCLYFDTDSIIYVHRDEEPNPPLGNSLGEWTDELESGNWISEFVTCGPKNYAYRLHHPDKNGNATVCKIRGFTLNVRAGRRVNFDKMVKLINHKDREDCSIPITYYQRIHRHGLKRGATIESRSETKNYRFVYTKRRIVPDPVTNLPTYTLPFGYQLQ